MWLYLCNIQIKLKGLMTWIFVNLKCDNCAKNKNMSNKNLVFPAFVHTQNAGSYMKAIQQPWDLLCLHAEMLDDWLGHYSTA